MGLNAHIRRVGLPVAVVVGAAAIGAGVWPAIASDGAPDLPDVSAEELLVRIAESDTTQLSGTVRVQADLGFSGVAELARGLDGPAGRLADLAGGTSTLRIAVDGPDRQRLALVEGTSDRFALIHRGQEVWAYDSDSNIAYRAEVPLDAERGEPGADELGAAPQVTPQAAVEQLLERAGEVADVSVDGTARVAGRSAYQLLVEPKDEVGGSVESARISVDAETGVPLAVTMVGSDGPLVDLAFSQITYGQPSGGSFDFTPPQDATVVDIAAGDPLPGLLPDAVPDFLAELPVH